MSVFRQLTVGEFFFESTADGVTAHAGGGAPNAYQIGTAAVTRFTTVATTGDSAMLPPAKRGLSICVINHGANPMQIFPQPGDQINDTGATGVPQMQMSVVFYFATSEGLWYTEGLASGFAAGYATFSSVDNLVAHAGGGQALATPLTAMYNRVITVGTAADSVVLPPSKAGMEITVTNAAALNSMNVFPATGEAINALAVNTAFAVAAGKTATFYCATAGQWHSILSA